MKLVLVNQRHECVHVLAGIRLFSSIASPILEITYICSQKIKTNYKMDKWSVKHKHWADWLVCWGLTSHDNYDYERRRRVELWMILPAGGFFNVLQNLNTQLPRLNGPRKGWHVRATFTSPILLPSLARNQAHNPEVNRPIHYQPSYQGQL